MEQIKNQPDRDHPVMAVAVGKSIYRVSIHFNEKSKDTLEDKLRKLLHRDVETKGICKEF